MNVRSILRLCVFTFFLVMVTCFAHAQNASMTENKALVKTHAKILKKYEGVNHITAIDVLEKSSDDIILFDVREKNEFAVSHIKNAIWIDPDMESGDFLETYGHLLSDKMAVLYCSVGVRSSILAQKLELDPNTPQSADIYNLKSGIFDWHNQSLTLHRGEQVTDDIHPYNRIWGRMVNRKENKRYTPSPEDK